MSLSELAQTDLEAILSLDCDTATITAAPESLALSLPLVVSGHFIRRGMTRDGEGLAVVGESASLSVSLRELASKGITDPESLKLKGWAVTVQGQSYRFDASPIDYTLGEATIILKRIA